MKNYQKAIMFVLVLFVSLFSVINAAAKPVDIYQDNFDTYTDSIYIINAPMTNTYGVTAQLAESFAGQDKALKITSTATSNTDRQQLQIAKTYDETLYIEMDVKFQFADNPNSVFNMRAGTNSTYSRVSGTLLIRQSSSTPNLEWQSGSSAFTTIYPNVDSDAWYHLEVVYLLSEDGTTRTAQVSMYDISKGVEDKKTVSGLSMRTMSTASQQGASFPEIRLVGIGLNAVSEGTELLIDNLKMYAFGPSALEVDFVNYDERNVELQDDEVKAVEFTTTVTDENDKVYTGQSFAWSVTRQLNGNVTDVPVGVSINASTGTLTIDAGLAGGQYTFVVTATLGSDHSVYGEAEISVLKHAKQPGVILAEFADDFKFYSYAKDGNVREGRTYALDDDLTLSDDVYWATPANIVISGYKIGYEFGTNNHGVISIESDKGVVIPQKAAGQAGTVVTLTGTFNAFDPESGALLATVTKDYVFRVVYTTEIRPLKAFQLDLIEFNKINLPATTQTNLGLIEQTFEFGSKLSWEVSDMLTISKAGVITRKDMDTTVTVIATLINGVDSKSNSFPVTVAGTGRSSGGSGNRGSGSSLPSQIFAVMPPLNDDALDNIQTPESSRTISFRDLDIVPWAKEAILFLNENNIVNGVSEYEFGVQRSVTRAQAITMLVRAFSLSSDGSGMTFLDVPTDYWAYEFIKIGYETGLVNGVNHFEYAPDFDLSRQDLCVILYNTLKKIGYDFKDNSDIYSFADDDKMADYAKTAVYALYYEGLISGVGNEAFEPERTATRAETAVLLYNIL